MLKIKTLNIIFIGLFFSFFFFNIGAYGAEWSSTNVQLLTGSGYELGEENREILTFQHANGWKYGSNFFFFDITQPFDDGTDVYGEWYTWLSEEKIFGKNINLAIIDDISLGLSINTGANFRAYLAGLTLHFNFPNCSFFTIDVMFYDDQKESEGTYIITPAWDSQFNLSNIKLRFSGYVDFIGAEGKRENQILTQPQILIDAGHFWNTADKLFIGIEYQYWKNKFGIRAIDESLPQAVLIWEF